MLRRSSGIDWPVALLGWIMVGVHYLLFNRFFPNAQGYLGHDYSYVLPMLLDGYYWFLNNGFHALPWFTPSFCGGMPQLANPASVYLSAPQFLTFLAGPLAGVRLTLLLFAAAGFWGFHHLLTRVFLVRAWPALLGGALFLFNGFFAFRMAVGHLEFHGFMLVPPVATLLLAEPPPGPLHSWRTARNILAAALLIGYMFLSGMAQLMPPALAAVVSLALAAKVLRRELSLRRFFLGFAVAGVISLGISAAKLAASLSFLASIPRENYPLPGVEGFWRLLGLAARMLAFGGGGIDEKEVISNSLWILRRHEFEYGVGVVPFLLVAAGMLRGAGRWRSLPGALSGWRGARLPLVGIFFLLAVPLALNYFSPGWNAFLKALPGARNLTTLMRWFVLYVPMVILAAVLVLDRAEPFRSHARWLAWGGLALLLGQNALADLDFYQRQRYDPSRVEAAYRSARARGGPPQITHLVAGTGGGAVLSGDRNDTLVDGHSQLLCYEPMFGYRLEHLPFGSIHPGPVLESDGAVFNMKHPACYLYPAENGCEPGGHFGIDQRNELAAFASYRPFAYRKSAVQRAADRASLVALGLAAIWIFCYAGMELRHSMARRG